MIPTKISTTKPMITKPKKPYLMVSLMGSGDLSPQ
jgi:hypothetical protein